MKIAILSFYSGHFERGVENWVFQLANHLSSKHEVVVFQNGPVRDGSSYKVVSSSLNVDWSRKDSRGTFLRRFFLDYWSLLVLRFVLKNSTAIYKGNFDIVIVCDNGWETSLARLLTLIRGNKLVCVGHSGKGWDERVSIFITPNVFVGLSLFARDWARRVNPFVKSVYIPNGVDVGLFNTSGPKQKLGLERPIVLSVGAPEEGKRFELVVSAVSKMEKGSLLILGGGHNSEYLKKLGKDKLGDRFLIKRVDFDEMPSYYRSADVFVLPTWMNEAFGLVYLEAMACGLPVVANNDSIRREIVGDAGIFVDNPENSRGLANAIETALKTDWGDKPRKQAERFSWDKIVAKYEELFESLIKK